MKERHFEKELFIVNSGKNEEGETALMEKKKFNHHNTILLITQKKKMIVTSSEEAYASVLCYTLCT